MLRKNRMSWPSCLKTWTKAAKHTEHLQLIGTQGLMISKRRTADGKDWEWTTAITAAGMIADTIVAGLLADQTGRNYWNLNTGEFVAGNATIKNLSGNDSIEIANAIMKIVNNKYYTGRIGSNNLRDHEDVTGLVFELIRRWRLYVLGNKKQ